VRAGSVYKEKKMSAKDEAAGTELSVPFTNQQLTLLDKVVAEGRHGKTVEEVCLEYFREYAAQYFGRGETRK
jgi:hypothetical protein